MASDVSHSKFSSREVHRIGILDIRILNTDRNDANILVVEPWTEGGAGHDSMNDSMHDSMRDSMQGSMYDSMGAMGAVDEEGRLVPIDHGYCLPTNLEVGWCDWCWYDWPQAKVMSRSSTSILATEPIAIVGP